MFKKILYTLGIFLIIVTGFSTGFTISDKIANIQKSSQKAEVMIDPDHEEDNNIIDGSLKNINSISFNPQIDIEKQEIKEEPKVEAKIENKKIIKKEVECPTPEIEYEDMFLRAVNQDYGLADFNYIPKNLEKVDILYSTKSGICLIKEAKENFEKMVEQAKFDGYEIKVSSGFRNYDTQKYLLANEIKIGNPNAEIAVAKAGYSEHQLGTAVDVTGQSISYDSASNKFNETEEAKWMKENASDYGFIMSYPLGKEDSTGYQYEPWHYRYVGVNTAKEVLKSGKTLTEYLKSLKR